MSEASKLYTVDPGPGVKKQIEDLGIVVQKKGHLARFIGALEKAVRLLQTDAHGWGDPEYRSKHVNALYCHATIRPVAFRYVIYEEIRGVVLLGVWLFADFD